MRTLTAALIATVFLLLGCTAATPGPSPSPTAPPVTLAPATPTAAPPTPTAEPVTATAPPATPTAAPVTPAPTATPAPEPTAGGAAVTILDFSFQPQSLEVSAGTEVTWTHQGAAPHTVTFDEGESSGALETGGVFRRTFESAGSFDYICAIHPAMRGTITVAD
ncbi:MAG TPA: cupredoxin domain-containing protein [Candidatus Limnocylindria bacterium]|nr:cupredoxin domain-containing protein [Candidatus Limnocylindria bacterium]